MDRNPLLAIHSPTHLVALRKESVDRNSTSPRVFRKSGVALRKESVDRNRFVDFVHIHTLAVALRKESVDRNITLSVFYAFSKIVALRKESVDRNTGL